MSSALAHLADAKPGARVVSPNMWCPLILWRQARRLHIELRGRVSGENEMFSGVCAKEVGRAVVSRVGGRGCGAQGRLGAVLRWDAGGTARVCCSEAPARTSSLGHVSDRDCAMARDRDSSLSLMKSPRQQTRRCEWAAPWPGWVLKLGRARLLARLLPGSIKTH